MLPVESMCFHHFNRKEDAKGKSSLSPKVGKGGGTEKEDIITIPGWDSYVVKKAD